MGFDKLIYSWTVVFPIAVLLYYFFRKRFEEQKISSTLFWAQSMRETKVSPYLKNLQRNALFYLQMAALLLLLFILLGPFMDKEEVVSGHTIIVVDTSASMLAEKEGEAFFESHRRAMKELVEKRKGQPVTIVTTGKEPVTVLRDETDQSVIVAAIEKLAVSYEHEYMERAIEFTRSMAADSGADIHIYTDSLERTAIPEGDGSIAWTVNGVDQAPVNISIDKFGAVKTPNGTEAVSKLYNYAEHDVDGDIRIIDILTGAVLAEEAFAIEGGKELLVSFKDLPDTDAIRAEIVVEDNYDVDNTAFFLLGNDTVTAVVDRQLHELVKKAFEAIGLSVTTGGAMELTAAQNDSVVVTNDVAYLDKGTAPVILIGRNDSTAKQVMGAVKSTDDPLFTIMPIDDVYVSEVYPSFDGFTTIATVGDEPFIQKSGRGDIIVLADIEMTDWPLHPSFPLFMWSTVELLRAEVGSLGTFVPNERKTVISGGTAENIEVYTIDDEYVVTIPNHSSFIAPSLPGVYKARDGEIEKLFSVALESSEKALLASNSFKIGKVESGVEVESGKWMIGFLFILPIILLLLMEWEVQRRRGYPN